ncbi:MAG: hypothetical protein ACP5MX_00455 [Candidatus Micrarchaeia archaeon]
MVEEGKEKAKTSSKDILEATESHIDLILRKYENAINNQQMDYMKEYIKKIKEETETCKTIVNSLFDTDYIPKTDECKDLKLYDHMKSSDDDINSRDPQLLLRGAIKVLDEAASLFETVGEIKSHEYKDPTIKDKMEVAASCLRKAKKEAEFAMSDFIGNEY